MIEARQGKDGKTRYRVRVGHTKKTIGTRDTRRDARKLEAEWELEQQLPSSGMTCEAFAARWAAGERWDNAPVRESTITTGRYGVKGFRTYFAGVPLERVDQNQALAFARQAKPHEILAAKALFADATKRGLVASDPFAHIKSNRGPGRKHDQALTVDQVAELEAAAVATYPGDYGRHFAAMIRFAAYVGPRISMQLALTWDDIDLEREVVTYRASFDRIGEPVPWTKETEEGQTWPVVLLPEAREALLSIPRPLEGGYVFRAKRGGRLRPGNHYALWNPVRAAARMPEVDWHALRHACAHHFYVTLGYSAELTGYQLTHADGEQVRKLYGHGQQDALERLHQGMRGPKVVELDRISGPSAAHEAGGSAS